LVLGQRGEKEVGLRDHRGPFMWALPKSKGV
jgi:hypothetical protein